MQKTKVKTARRIEVSDESLTIIVGSRRYRFAWEECSPTLAKATPQQRKYAQLSPGGYGIHWPEIDEDLDTDGLLHGAPAPRQGAHIA